MRFDSYEEKAVHAAAMAGEGPDAATQAIVYAILALGEVQGAPRVAAAAVEFIRNPSPESHEALVACVDAFVDDPF